MNKARSSNAPKRRRSSERSRARGISLMGFLVFLLLAYGIYAFAFKRSDKAESREAEAGAPTAPSVVIYTTSSCEPCDRAKAWLKQRRIAFEERDVETSAIYEEQLKHYESRIVPVILVNGEPQYGFQSAYLEQALNDADHKHRD